MNGRGLEKCGEQSESVGGGLKELKGGRYIKALDLRLLQVAFCMNGTSDKMEIYLILSIL